MKRFWSFPSCVSATFALAALLAAGGCESNETKPTPTARRPVRQSISKEEMVYRIQTNIQRIATVKGKCRVIAIDQSQVVPASPRDAQLQEEGKPFNAMFNRHNLQGAFVLDRSTPGVPPRFAFRAEVPGVMPVLEALALDDAFWVKVLNPDRGLEGMRAILYRGRLDPDTPRSERAFTMRPQDFVNLYFCHQLLATADFYRTYTRETWPDYYILNVMAVDPDAQVPWATRLHSRIWVERHNLNVAIHQLYDTNGEMVAEARFSNYVRLPVRIGEERRTETVSLPRGIKFVWPKDRVIIEVRFSEGDLMVNRSIPDATWRPPRDVDAVVRDLTPETADEYYESLLGPPVPDVPGPREPGDWD